jgi:hypothetical protein
MSKKNYEQVNQLTSRIINARFGEMVGYSEQLITTGVWRDFTPPVGTHFVFRADEYDYFLAAMNIDALTMRYAYIQKGSVVQQHHLADITGRGRASKDGDRRPREVVAKLYADAPDGAGARILAWGRKEMVVSEGVARAARDPKHRRQREKGAAVSTRPSELRWEVRWYDGRPAAQAIVDRLAQDPDLEREVYKLLDAARRTRDNFRKKTELSARNSKGNGKLGARHA